ncbi:Interferon-induced 6-16 [Pyrenophora seminiperda CCB06]|uniref:Interferon-induced 6-16 n=1 Tax=Pyrenophora seminiperda CCB06 TaxID=1302712 RepID=A0A3M7M022_9PLEO|nr:Interferon-induced 6-16 [Pyrenophora seminiperda CCB06]
MEEGLASNAHVSGSNVSHSFEACNHQLRGSLRNASPIGVMKNTHVLPGTIDTAVIHLTIAIRAARMQAEDALGTAIVALKNMGITVVMKAAMVWMKSHLWEAAALIVPVLLTACTPAFLGLAGFTAGGIAAGSIAAGIQAGIGNVAAGSIFATLTSAAMSGYGVPIVFGGVWGISSVVCWGLAAWKKSRQDP